MRLLLVSLCLAFGSPAAAWFPESQLPDELERRVTELTVWLSDALGGEALQAEWSKDRWFSSESAGDINACYHYESVTGNFYPQRIPALVAIDYLGREVLPAVLTAVGEEALGAELSRRAPSRNHLDVHALAEQAEGVAHAPGS